jgi:hypothetical protein
LEEILELDATSPLEQSPAVPMVEASQRKTPFFFTPYQYTEGAKRSEKNGFPTAFPVIPLGIYYTAQNIYR